MELMNTTEQYYVVYDVIGDVTAIGIVIGMLAIKIGTAYSGRRLIFTHVTVQ